MRCLRSSVIAVLLIAGIALGRGPSEKAIAMRRAAKAEAIRKDSVHREIEAGRRAQEERALGIGRTLTRASVRRLPDSLINLLVNHSPSFSDEPWVVWVLNEERRRAGLPPLRKSRVGPCVLADGSAAPGYERLEMNLWEGQQLYRTTTCDYVADVIGIDADGDVVLRTVADGDVVTLPRQLVQARFVARAR